METNGKAKNGDGSPHPTKENGNGDVKEEKDVKEEGVGDREKIRRDASLCIASALIFDCLGRKSELAEPC